MPALDVRVSRDTIRAMRQSMPPEEFGREFLVWWDAPDEFSSDGLDVDRWLAMDDASSGPLAPIAFGVTVAPERDRSWIGVAGRRDGDLVQVELAAEARGTRWVVGWLAERIPRWNPSAVVLDGTALSLAAPLEELGFEVRTTTSVDRTQATVGFFDLFNAEKLRHPGEDQLTDAVRSVTKRPMSNGFVWDGPQAGPLVAVTLATYGVVTTAAPPPPPSPRRLASDAGPSRATRGQRGDVDVASAGF